MRVFPRSVTDRNKAWCLHNNHFCLIWKSENVNFNQTFEELKDNFKIVDIFYVTEKNVNSLFKYQFIPNSIEPPLTNFNTVDLETRNTDRARPCCISFYRINELTGKKNRDLTPYEKEKGKKDILLFDGDDCIIKALDFVLKFKGKERKVKKKV